MKPKNCHFSNAVSYFRACSICGWHLCQPIKRGKSAKYGLFQLTWKNYTHFWVWLSYNRHLIPNFAVIAKCLHGLVGPTHIKKTRKQGRKILSPLDSDGQSTKKVFDLQKACLTSMPVLGYPDFSPPDKLEMDAPLQGLGAALFQRDESGRSMVIAYATQSLCSSEQSIGNYS